MSEEGDSDEDWERPLPTTGYQWRWSDWVGAILLWVLPLAVLGYAIWRFRP